MAKATVAEIEFRIGKVRKLLLDGRTRSFIVRYGSKTWAVSSRQIDDYIARATEELLEVNKASAAQTLARLEANLSEIYRKAKKRDLYLARQTLMDLAKLRGLDKIQIDMSIEERPLESESEENLEALAGAKE